jgi:hypothetical protein
MRRGVAVLPIEDWAAAVRVRKSRRAFKEKRPIPHHFAELAAHCEGFVPFEGVRVVAVERPSTYIFTGIIGGYGKIKDAPSVLLFIGQEGLDHVEAMVGYTAEAAILEATRLGFATCWVSGSFNRRKVGKLVDLEPGEKVFAVAAVGYAIDVPDRTERFMSGAVKSGERKPMSEIAPGVDSGKWPAWAFEGVLLARLAPSAANLQPWRFRLEDGAAVVSVDGPDGRYPKALDCGIAMLHFELGALTNGGVGGWELLEAPDVARYRLAEEAHPDGDA